jgi:hypothetical protein
MAAASPETVETGAWPKFPGGGLDRHQGNEWRAARVLTDEWKTA